MDDGIPLHVLSLCQSTTFCEQRKMYINSVGYVQLQVLFNLDIFIG